MAVGWTRDQEKVINSRDRNLLVSAAAGSGKTAVLVERIVRMVTDDRRPVDLDRLLVMTFTNAAAAEMRERIGKAVHGCLKEKPDCARLRLQAALIPHAQIQTIDSFCLSLIRNHYAGLDIDPSFRIGDEGELTLLQADVMAELLEEHYEAGDEEFEQFVETYGSGKTDSGIEEVIYQVCRFAVSHPWPKEWINRCRQEFEEEGIRQFTQCGWVKFLVQEVKLQMEEFGRQLLEAINVCQEPGGPEVYLPTLLNDREMVERVGASENFEELRERLLEVEFGRLSAARKKDIDPEKKEFASSVRKRVKDAVKKCQNQYASQTMEETREAIIGCAPAVKKLLDLAEGFMERYCQAKRERNLLDFGDLEHYALEILYKEGKPSPVADELGAYYEEILVDEYQDSNFVQEALLEAISGERFGRPNVFMVGDVKQSIYRFRQARPELFLEKYRAYGTEEGKCQKIELQKNFRSRSQVLESINQVFYQIMTENLGGIPYTKETALYPGALFQPLPAGNPGGTSREGDGQFVTELLMADTGSRELSSLDEEARDFTSREIEVKLAVRRIRELTDPEKGMTVWDKEEGRYRPARYGDIVILLRSLSGWAELLVNGLMNEGIPAHAQSQAGYFDTTEVETVLSLLAVIDNPIQDIPLAAVMRSPIIGMNDEELAWMMARFKRKGKKGQDRGIYGAWRMWLKEGWGKAGREEESGKGSDREETGGEEAGREGTGKAEAGREGTGKAEAGREESGKGKAGREEAGEPGEGKSIWKKLVKMDKLVSHFRYLAGIFPIHRLLEQIYRETGYYAYVSAMPAGETRQANLDLLIEKAAAYESTSYHGLFHFIRYIERLKKVETDFGEAAVAGAKNHTVRIMSIHKSKGLEFPIVILAGMGKRFNKQDANARLLIDPDFGVGADFLDLEMRLKSVTLKKQVLKRRLELEGLGEELRVLYVAMTRAKEKLIMTGTDAGLEKKLETQGLQADGDGRVFPAPRAVRLEGKDGSRAVPYTLLTKAVSYLDWMLMALPNAGGTIDTKVFPVASFIGHEVLEQMEKQNLKERLLEQAEDGGWAPKYRKKLEESLHFTYPHQEDVSLYAMMSVSELKRRGQAEEEEGIVSLFPGEEEEREDLPRTASETLETGEKKDSRFRPGKGGGATRGTAYHRALELILGEEFASAQDVARRLNGLAEEGRFLKDARKLVNAGILWKFFTSPLGKRMIKAGREGRLHKEQQFMIGIPAREMDLADSDELVLIQGMIDAYMEEEDGLVLVDYKTDYVEGAEELIRRYHVQIQYYIRALEQVSGKKVKEALIYSLHLQEEIPLAQDACSSCTHF